MDHRNEKVIRRTSAEAHADQPGPDKKLAGKYAKSRRTMARWRKKGPPALRDAQLYLMNAPNPFRAFSTLKVASLQARMDDLSDDELIERYHELLNHDKETESEDTKHDLCRRTNWLDKSLSSERDGASDLEKAACERLFAARGISAEEVFAS